MPRLTQPQRSAGTCVAAVMFLLLQSSMGGARQAMLVMLNLPLALIGGIATVYVTESPSVLWNTLALVGIVVVWAAWALRSWGRPVRNPVERMPERWSQVLLVVVLVYGVLRNLPFAPFRSLAP